MSVDDSLWSDLFVRANGELAGLDVRSEISTGHLLDFDEDGDDRTRTNTAFVELSAPSTSRRAAGR